MKMFLLTQDSGTKVFQPAETREIAALIIQRHFGRAVLTIEELGNKPKEESMR